METIVDIKAPKECCSTRTTLWYLVFTGFAVNYMIRLNLNIALVSMIQPKTRNVTVRTECAAPNDITHFHTTATYATIQGSITANDTSANWTHIETTTLSAAQKSRQKRDQDRTYFDWNEKDQANILGSFFWLHWITQIPGGILGAKYGTKVVFGWSNFLGVLGSYFIPWFAHKGTMYLIFIRGLQGLVSGFCWPSMHSMTAKWIPPNERSKFVTAYMGSSVGAGITYPLCGFIIDKWGWEMVFYTSGVLGTVWFLAWLFFVYDTPSEHPRISDGEREYIRVSLGKSVSRKTLSTPWRKILTDGSLCANIIAQIGGIWGLYTLTVNGPSYFNFIHGWNIRDTGLLSGMPHFFRILFAYIISMLGDYLLKSNKMTRTNVRKFAVFFCCGIQGVFLLSLAYSGCNKTAAIVFMTLAIGVNGAVSTGPLASLVDISPNYSSILLGVCNTMVSIVGFCTPAVVGYFTYQNQTTAQWQKVFWVCAAMLFASCIYYLLFSSSDLASWNSPAEESQGPETEMMVMKSYDKIVNKEIESLKSNKSENTGKIMYSNEAIY